MVSYEKFQCPISLDIMKDPVVLIPTGFTFDRENICKALLIQPNRCPVTGSEFTSPLSLVDNVSMRSELIEVYGEEAYKRYIDPFFDQNYKQAWNQLETDVEPISVEPIAGADVGAGAGAAGAGAGFNIFFFLLERNENTTSQSTELSESESDNEDTTYQSTELSETES